MHKSMKTIFISLLVVMLLAGFSSSVSAATVTWSGGGLDNLTSNPANWSGNIVPQYGDDAIIDGTSIKNSTWDLNLTLAGLTIKSGYTGKVTKISAVSLVIAKNVVSPSAPSGLGAVAISSSQINLSWTDNSNNETGFKIERKTGVGRIYNQIATVGANISTYSNTGLLAGTTYYYRIKAYNGVGDSAYSNEVSATTTAVA
ncbi:MAG: fibronectin type III domain-containing protein, partial [Nitrospirae bacterium]|nr:fibronectin type III domain-containing protein [Nitrospirota bacterium]